MIVKIFVYKIHTHWPMVPLRQVNIQVPPQVIFVYVTHQMYHHQYMKMHCIQGQDTYVPGHMALQLTNSNWMPKRITNHGLGNTDGRCGKLCGKCAMKSIRRKLKYYKMNLKT